MRYISGILFLFIYTFSLCQVDTFDLAQLNFKAPYNFKDDSVWVEDINSILNLKEIEHIQSLDSALNVATNHRFIHAVIHSLLDMRHDSGYQVIVNNLKSKSYVRPSSPLGGKKYPVIEAILSADRAQLPFFREFLFKSNYFEKEINPEDIYFYRFLMLAGYPECDTWKVITKPSTIYRNNLQSILDLHVIFNY